MKISNKIVKKFQEGGPMPAEGGMDPMGGAAPAQGGAPAPEQGGGDPIMQLAEVAMQALETQDCQAAMAVCEAFISMIQPQGGAAPAPAGAPAGGAPVFKKGGVLVGRK